MNDTLDDIWAHIPGGDDELAALAYKAEKEEKDAEDELLRGFKLQQQAKERVLNYEAAELARRMVAEKAALERGPLSSRVLNRAGLRNLELPKHLMRDVLYTGSVAVFLGDSQVGKSWVLQAMACCAVSGLTWPQMVTNSKGKLPVLYIAAEDGGSIEWRFRHWENSHGRSLDDTPIHVLAEPVNLLDDVVIDELCEFIGEHQVRLVIIDTVSATFGGEEETNENFARMVRNCRRISAAMAPHGGGSTALAHHFGKDKEKGGRGGSSLFNDADIVWSLTGTIDDIRMECKKWKVDEKRRPIHLRLNRDDREAVHLVEHRPAGGSVNDSEPPESVAMAEAIVEAITHMRDQNQGYGPNTRAILGRIRERGGQFRTQALTEQLEVMSATMRLIMHNGPRGSKMYRLPPVQEQLNDGA